MAKKKMQFGGNVNPQYINPAGTNKQFGQFQNKKMNTAGNVIGIAGSQLEGSEAQNAVSQAGPWGAIIGTASKIGTSIGEGIGGDTGGAVKGMFDPAGVLMNKDLSVGKRIIGAGIPMVGGAWASRAARKKKEEAKRKATAQSNMLDAQYRSSQMVDNTPDVQVMKSGGWISKAINPKHVGFCTPLSKPTCTGHRRALALRFKKGGDLHKKAYGGNIVDGVKMGNTKLLEYGGTTHEESPIGGTPVDANGQITNLNNADALVEKKEVAWNRGKGDTYIFSDRLGFAKEAKNIMKKYEKRLGKKLDGVDNISKNTMNMELSNLENRQEAVKSELEKTQNIQMANGGSIPTPTYRYPETGEKFNAFKQDLESSDRAKDFARLYHYKQVLDPLLQAKDTKNYSEITKNIPKNLSERIKLADTAYKEGKYSAYLSPQEAQTALGDKYEDYVALMNKLQKPEMGISGTKEGEKPVQEMRYGLRSSLAITPYSNTMVNTIPGGKDVKSEFGAEVYYNPKTNAYDYQYKEPKEYSCGGKIKKMDRGGTIPYRNVIPYNTMTPSENIDYLGRNVVKPLKSLGYKSPEPKGIGTYMGSTIKPEVREKSYLGDIVPIAGSTALSMAGTAYALKNLKKPKDVRFTRLTPQQINLETARESLRQSAKEGMANIRTAAKGVGSPNYMNEIISGTLGTQRGLGKELTQSYLAEQTANASAREEANRANLAAEAQEAGLNIAQRSKYEDTKAGLTSNLFTLPAMGVSEYLGQKNISDMAQLGAKYKFITNPKNRFRRIMVAKGDKE